MVNLALNMMIKNKSGKNLDDREAVFLAGLKKAVADVRLIKAGKLKGMPAKELLNEL